MMAQDQAESSWIPTCYESFINQFPADTVKSMRQLERTYTKMCKQKMSVLFNEICINEEIQSMCVCVCVYWFLWFNSVSTFLGYLVPKPSL